MAPGPRSRSRSRPWLCFALCIPCTFLCPPRRFLAYMRHLCARTPTSETLHVLLHWLTVGLSALVLLREGPGADLVSALMATLLLALYVSFFVSASWVHYQTFAEPGEGPQSVGDPDFSFARCGCAAVLGAFTLALQFTLLLVIRTRALPQDGPQDPEPISSGFLLTSSPRERAQGVPGANMLAIVIANAALYKALYDVGSFVFTPCLGTCRLLRERLLSRVRRDAEEEEKEKEKDV